VLDLSIITDKLLVGTQVTTEEDLDTLKNLGVSAVLSVQSDEDLRHAGLRWDIVWRLGGARGIEMRRCPVTDFSPGDLIQKLDKCVDTLHELVVDHGRVYIHCTAGINRSTGVTLSYLVLKERMTVDAAYRLIKGRRPQANPYRHLLEHLQERIRDEHFSPR